MTVQYSSSLNAARLDATETHIGTNAGLLIYSGVPPASADAAPTGTLLLAISLPSDWMAAASGPTKAKTGTWSGVGLANGTAGYFRVCNGSPTNVGQIQGNINTTGSSPTPDMEMDNTSIAVSQVVTVSAFQINAANQ